MYVAWAIAVVFSVGGAVIWAALIAVQSACKLVDETTGSVASAAASASVDVGGSGVGGSVVAVLSPGVQKNLVVSILEGISDGIGGRVSVARSSLPVGVILFVFVRCVLFDFVVVVLSLCVA
jgi:hypothetical protein